MSKPAYNVSVGDMVRRIAEFKTWPLPKEAIVEVAHVTPNSKWFGIAGFPKSSFFCDYFEIVEKAPAKQVPKKHADVIKAWADGFAIQVQSSAASDLWYDVEPPDWDDDLEYRVKPIKAQDIVREIGIVLGNQGEVWLDSSFSNVKLTFDGDTHKLTSVELIGESTNEG